VSVIFFDCFSGAAGDMLLGALIDAGAPESTIRRSLNALGLPGWSLEVGEVRSHGIRAVRAKVSVSQSEPARSYRDVVAVLEHSDLDDNVRTRALRTFEHLAESEARVHGVEVERVHLHEVGATDALIDVVGTCAALEHFSPSVVACSPIPTGIGSITAEHGELPLPAPAVADLLRGVPLYSRGHEELITPTGAALLVAACNSFGSMPAMTLSSVGYGAGERVLSTPNVVRVLVGQAVPVESDRALVIETNIDDLSPELVPHIIEQLIEAGAQDAWTTPIVMKKGRSALTMSVLCDEAARDKLMDIIFAETTTLGVRVIPVAKHALQREWINVEVHGHTVSVKVARRHGDVVTIAPEYEGARAVARATGVPLKEVYSIATKEAHRSLQAQNLE
jgi:pyridinium-3,5-bisthiocarboxylic acid mononucleotide nickel chelatase